MVIWNETLIIFKVFFSATSALWLNRQLRDRQRTYGFLMISGGIDNQFAQIGLIRQVKFSDSQFISQHHTMSGTLHKKWSFPLRISSVNVTKSAVSWPSTAQNIALNLLNKKETAVSSTTFRRNHLPNDKSQPDNTNFKLCKENEILKCL